MFMICFADSNHPAQPVGGGADSRKAGSMLTRKQQLLLQFIHERLQEEGVPPSFDEMKEALELKSKSGIHRLIMALEERGFIRRLPNRARALEVIKMPESWGSKDESSGSVIQADFGTARKPALVRHQDNVTPFPGSGRPRKRKRRISDFRFLSWAGLQPVFRFPPSRTIPIR